MPIRIRIPYWTDGAEIRVNGQVAATNLTPSTFAEVNRTWDNGDRVYVSLPMSLHLAPIPDDPSITAIMYGPVLLAGALGTENFDPSWQFYSPGWSDIEVPCFIGSSSDLSSWIEPVEGQPLTFRTVGAGVPSDVTLIPFYKLFDQRYAVYWRLHPAGVGGSVRDPENRPIRNAVVQIGGVGGLAAITGVDGAYFLDNVPSGTQELYCDAPGFKPSFQTVTIPTAGRLVRNVVLTPTAEIALYNGDFETAGAGGLPDGWEGFVQKWTGTDQLGNPWPDPNPDMYLFGRASSDNPAPGGSAAGTFAFNKPHPNPGVRWIEKPVGDPYWSGTIQSLTATVLTGTSTNWDPNFWTDSWRINFVTLTKQSGAFSKTYKVVGATSSTLTVSGSIITDGFAVGDRYQMERRTYEYWYKGGLQTAATRRMPVDPNSKCNLYLKIKTTESYIPDGHYFALLWRDSAGVLLGDKVDRAWQPDSGWNQVLLGNFDNFDGKGWGGPKPMLRITPPPGAA